MTMSHSCKTANITLVAACAAAAHAACVMPVSAARMYWLLRHARDINIVPPTSRKKNRLGLCRFSVQWNRLHGNSRVRSMIAFVDFSQNLSEQSLLVLKNSIMISITKIGIVEPVTLK